MNVIIVGGGRTGSHLARLLHEQNHAVRLIEHRPDTLAGLHRELPTEAIFEGEGTDPMVLESAGIREAQVLAAVTNVDSDNLVISSLARQVYGVKRIIARINNPRHAWLFSHEMGVDVALNQADLMAKLIEEEMSLGDMMILSKLRRGKYTLVEEKIYPGAIAIGVALKDLKLPHNCTISGIIRQGEMILPRGPTILDAEDEIVALVDDEGAVELARLLGRPADFK
ncbi:MAG TPA: TrkA family potassium uptake protein [Anaerolineales bacterium]|nr:TrkA family potassium uptake protein [Anaerolineales bacterium]